MSFPEFGVVTAVRLTQPMVNSLALPPGKADAIYFDTDEPFAKLSGPV